MKRVLLTGMSGAGKSRTIEELVRLGHRAIDLDNGWCDVQPDGRQLWRESAVEELLSTEVADLLVLGGCEENMRKFLPCFDLVILLSAPTETLLDRVASRTNNPYGKAPGEWQRVLADIRTVEPLLRRIADHEIQTTHPVGEVAAEILHVVGATGPGAAKMPSEALLG